MKRAFLLACCAYGIVCCNIDSLGSLTNTEINQILSLVDESDERFVQKGINFDSIVVYAGYRIEGELRERIKMNLYYYYGDYIRGYYKVPDAMNRDVQVFGRKSANRVILKAVTTDMTDDQGSFMIIEKNTKGIWASPHHNFERRLLDISKNNGAYKDLINW